MFGVRRLPFPLLLVCGLSLVLLLHNLSHGSFSSTSQQATSCGPACSPPPRLCRLAAIVLHDLATAKHAPRLALGPGHPMAPIRNKALHDGLLWSQTLKNASRLTYHDDRKIHHVSRIIHLLDQLEPSPIGIFSHHGLVSCLL